MAHDTLVPLPADHIAGVLQFITDRRAALDRLEAAMLEAQAIFGDSAPAPAPGRDAARRHPAALKRQATPAASPRSSRQPDTSALTQAVSAFLDRQRRPTTFAAVVAGVKSRPVVVRPIIQAMVEAGTVVKRGRVAGLRLGRPAVMAADDTEGD